MKFASFFKDRTLHGDLELLHETFPFLHNFPNTILKKSRFKFFFLPNTINKNPIHSKLHLQEKANCDFDKGSSK